MLNSKNVKKFYAPIQVLTLDYLVLWVHEVNSILARIACYLLKVAVEIMMKDPFFINSSPSKANTEFELLPFMSHFFHVKASQNQSYFTSPRIN